MKKIYFIVAMILGIAVGAHGQVLPSTNSVQQPKSPTIVPNQYQNNASYNNNSMQNNAPQNISSPVPGSNGQYTDPTGASNGNFINNNTSANPNFGRSTGTLWQNNSQVVQPGGLIAPGDTVGRNRPMAR